MLISSKESCDRLARAICSDIALYNKKLVKAVKSGSAVSPELLDAIEEGRVLYLSSTAPGYEALFNKACVELAGIAPPPPTQTMNTIVVGEVYATDLYVSGNSSDLLPVRQEKELAPIGMVLLIASVVLFAVVYYLCAS